MAHLALSFFLLAIVWAQQPPPPPKPPPPNPLPPAPATHFADLRKKLRAAKPVNSTAAHALQFSREFFDAAERASRSGQPFGADRLAAVSDALLRVAEHQQHLQTGGGPKGPPPARDIEDHLQRVYFRVRQADYFCQQAHDPRVASFPGWARDFYQLALRAYDHRDLVAADENAKSAEDIVMALENLAQAAAPLRPPPPPRPPAPPGPGRQFL